MLRHLPPGFGAAIRLPSAASADGLSIPVAAVRAVCAAAAIGLTRPRLSR
jgi:hypothetical protein